MEDMRNNEWSTARFLWIFGTCALLDVPLGLTFNWLYRYYDSNIFAVGAAICTISMFFCTMYFISMCIRILQDRARSND